MNNIGDEEKSEERGREGGRGGGREGGVQVMCVPYYTYMYHIGHIGNAQWDACRWILLPKLV